MNDRATGEINRRNFCVGIPHAIHPAVNSPDHVRDREIDDEHPDADEHKNCGKFHPFSHRADDQSRRDDREHQLIHREDILRDPVGIVGVRSRIDPVQKRKLQSADEGRPA